MYKSLRKIQSTPVMSYQLIPVRKTIIMNLRDNYWWGYRQRQLLGMKIYSLYGKHYWDCVRRKEKKDCYVDGQNVYIYHIDCKPRDWGDYCFPMDTAASFII